jgi:hypothetical protein
VKYHQKKEHGRERHHRHPKSRKKSYQGEHINEDRNITLVRPEYHRAYHLLFGNLLPNEMAELLNEVWISPDYYLVAFPRKKKKRSRRRTRLYCVDCSCEVLKHLKQTQKGE